MNLIRKILAWPITQVYAFRMLGGFRTQWPVILVSVVVGIVISLLLR